MYRLSKNKRLHVELTLISLCNITAEKKNSDKPVIPKEPVKTEKKEVEEKIVEKVQEQQRPEEKKEKPAMLNKPKSFSSFSIKEKLDQNGGSKVEEPEVVKKVEEPEVIQNKEFTEKELIDKWHLFSDKMGGKPRIFNTLTSKDPKLEEDNIVSFVIDNNLQEEKIKEIKNELLGFLKAELKNTSIDFKLIISDKEEENNKLYTAEDKYKHMLSKNEKLNNLKQEFNLDLE